jgi:hypothetical protein
MRWVLLIVLQKMAVNISTAKPVVAFKTQPILSRVRAVGTRFLENYLA